MYQQAKGYQKYQELRKKRKSGGLLVGAGQRQFLEEEDPLPESKDAKGMDSTEWETTHERRLKA